MQTLGASERKRKDAGFPRNALPPLAAWVSSFTSQPFGVKETSPSCLKCRAVARWGLWTDAGRAPEATGEPSIAVTAEGPGAGAVGGSSGSSL